MRVLGFDERRVRHFQRYATYYVMVRTGVSSAPNPSVASSLLLETQFRDVVEWAESQVTDYDTDALVFAIQHREHADVTLESELRAIELCRVPPLSEPSDRARAGVSAFPDDY